MAKFREFYVPAGAGSNFLAKQCLWLGNPCEWAPHDINQNEFFINRVKSDSKVMAYGIRNSDPTTASAKYYDCPDKSIISESARIKPILIELDKFISNTGNMTSDCSNRRMVISQCDRMWREDYSVWTYAFFLRRDKIILYYADKITQFEDYFAKCREYYYSECERNNWNMFQITHLHPYFSTSPRLKLPENIDTMAIELDVEMSIYNNVLIDIKMNERKRFQYYDLREDKDINKSVAISNKKVSYRKIFFENDEDEIRKMYHFFDNEEYFDENRVQIMSEFRQYHDDNMLVIQRLAPNQYEQLKTR